MSPREALDLGPIIGRLPYRLALAGGWIDQPFVSRLNPDPFGSMVVVSLVPTVRFMDRSGMATGTRKVALELWPGGLPAGDPAQLVKDLYEAENRNQHDPSGSQDMIGLIYPGISRLDYDFHHERGLFPRHIASNRDPMLTQWLERILYLIPVAPRPEGYHPLIVKQLEPEWIRRLGRSGNECYQAILDHDLTRLGAAMNECMRCWEALLPATVRHPAIPLDLKGLLQCYQSCYPGAMYSGCGGGYMVVASETPVPGAFQIKVRI